MPSSADKPLNQMNRLADMGHFPMAVHAGATANILLTLALTWWLQPHITHHFATDGHLQTQVTTLAIPLAWTALILLLNLTPVALLRLTLQPATLYPPLRSMNFWADQHKFSDWVYLAASANMAFWILTGWLLFTWRHTGLTLLAALFIAALATFSPVLRRSIG